MLFAGARLHANISKRKNIKPISKWKVACAEIINHFQQKNCKCDYYDLNSIQVTKERGRWQC